MALCRSCGQEIGDVKFCPNCGCPTHDGSTPGPATQAGKKRKPKKAVLPDSKQMTEMIDHLMDTPDTTADYAEQDRQDNRLFACFAYLYPLILVPFFKCRQSPFAVFHMHQGLALICTTAAVALTQAVVQEVIQLLGGPWFIQFLFNLPFFVGYLVMAGLMLVGFNTAFRGIARPLPLIGRIRVIPKD